MNALVYYILVKGTVMRDELSGILWGDKSDAIARKNLRNAIYETKKLLGPNVFVSPRKAIIKVNPDIDFKVDVTEFERDPGNQLDLYQGSFLQGFYVKDSPEYESWYLTERDRLEGLYLDVLFKSSRKLLPLATWPKSRATAGSSLPITPMMKASISSCCVLIVSRAICGRRWSFTMR